MTIAQALKEKNKKLNVLNKLWDKLSASNSIPEGNLRPYNPEELLEKITLEMSGYIELKTKIHAATTEVRDKIFRMSELKNYVKRLRQVDTRHGLSVSRYESSTVRYEAFLSEGSLDELIEKAEHEIDALQDELDAFNHTHHLS
ncbi:MAG: hypothetical protein LW688_02520 [Cryomorphaceae bacterium]|jgi:hypothetical protein|nr:hypothetical protein [Cryomorphaceae bacterium]